jgi:hypothetical protein
MAKKSGWLCRVDDKLFCHLHAAKHQDPGMDIPDLIVWRQRTVGMGMNWGRVTKDMREALSGLSRFTALRD